MKKILLLIASAAIALAVNAAPQKVDFGKLPKNSQEFIQKNFPGEKVKAVEMDREASWDKYRIRILTPIETIISNRPTDIPLI